MLMLREELSEVEDLLIDGLVEGALDRWLEKKLTLPPNKKKRKVVRVPVPDAYIHFIMQNPNNFMRELSDEEMAECPERYRQMYVIQKIIFNAKKRAYQKAIIDQYKTFGFAYDEKEATDDDIEKDVAVAN